MRIRTRAAALTAAAAAILVGATGARAITNGTPDGNGHPYVGMMVGFDASGNAWLCSGSLLSANVFLTAGHCTDGAVAVYVWFDQTWPGTLASADAVGTAITTDPDFCFGCGKGLPGADYRDVGIVELAPLQGGTIPSQYAALPSPGQVDGLQGRTPIDFVGYGVTFQAKIPGNLLPPGHPPLPPPYQRWDGFGTRMYAPSVMVPGNFRWSNEFLRLALDPGRGKGGSCFGDSGGPDLLGGTNTILAVNSFVTNSNCSGNGYSQRIDVPQVLDWIESFLQ